MATATTTRRTKKNAEVVTDTAASKVLSPEQVAELDQTKTDSKPTEGEAIMFHPIDGEPVALKVVRKLKTAIEVERNDQVERYNWAVNTPVFESAFDKIVKTADAAKAATPASDAKVKKADLGAQLTRSRAGHAEAWKEIDGGSPVGYIEACQRSITRLYQAQDLARQMIVQNAK